MLLVRCLSKDRNGESSANANVLNLYQRVELKPMHTEGVAFAPR